MWVLLEENVSLFQALSAYGAQTAQGHGQWVPANEKRFIPTLNHSKYVTVLQAKQQDIGVYC